MKLNARILRIDGSVTAQVISVENLAEVKFVSDAIVPVCTKLREADQTIAQVRVEVPGYEKPYRWMGHYTAEHMAAVVAREGSGTDDW